MFQAAARDRPCSLSGAGCAVSPFLAPALFHAAYRVNPACGCEGNGAPRGAAFVFRAAPSRDDAGASRRSTNGVRCGAGPRFRGAIRLVVCPSAPVPLSGLSRVRASGKRKAQPSASSWQGIASVPGRSPRAARVRALRRHARGRRACPTSRTPLEAPLMSRR